MMLLTAMAAVPLQFRDRVSTLPGLD